MNDPKKRVKHKLTVLICFFCDVNYCTKLKRKLFAFVVVVCIHDKFLASVGHAQMIYTLSFHGMQQRRLPYVGKIWWGKILANGLIQTI